MVREKIENLVKAIEKSSNTHKDDDLQAVEDMAKDCAKYIDSRTAHHASVNIAKYRMSGVEYREYIQDLDSHRRALHDKVVASVKLTNNLAKMYGANPAKHVS